MAAELIGGAALGALVSEGLKKLIQEAKNVLEFEPVSKELTSTMEDLRPIIIKIESLQKPEVLKSLNVTISKAGVLIKRCTGVKKWEIFEKAKCTKKVRKIQKEMVSFCQVQLQLLQLSNELQSTEDIQKLDNMMKDIDDNLEIITNKLDRLREETKNYHQDVMKKLEMATERIEHLIVIAEGNKVVDDSVVCPVPNLGKAPIEFDWPKKKLLNDSVDALLVSGAPGCDKTKLLTQMPPKKKVLDDFVVCPEEVKTEEKKMTHGVDLRLGSVGETLVSEVLKVLIKEAKKFKSFRLLSKDLVSTMEKLLPLTKEIDLKHKELDFAVGELKELNDTIERARVLVLKFPSVKFYEKPKYTREIEGINKDLLKFCQIDLQLLQHRNQLTLLDLTDNLLKKVDGLSKRMESFSVHAPVFRDLCSVPKVDKVFVGLDLPLMKVKKRLLDNDVVNLVVSAPPGCGKTTLVTQLCHDKDIKGKFKHIFFNVVSSAPNFRKLVQNLLQHNDIDPPTFVDDNHAINRLQELLKELRKDGPILMVLDDVWHGAELLLEKFKSIDLPGYKILVTSRIEFLSFGPTFKLKPLNDEDARALLIQWASRPPNASEDEYNDLLERILKRCNGVPLVLQVLGNSLKGRSLTSWKGQLESWSEGKTMIDHKECLQPSFNALESNLKECFLDMGLFLEDQMIRSSIIIDIWVEIYGKGVNPCMKYLEDLASRNLLTLVPLGRKEHDEGFYGEFFVTQHDILRELAICQSELETVLKRKRVNLDIRDNNFPEWCSNPERPIINAALLSISTDDLFSSSWVEMECPNVEALVLNISSLEYALPKFISTMKKLKVVIIINHSFYPARLNNFSCLSSLPSLKRIILEKVVTV